jgi:hypothetical protein
MRVLALLATCTMAWAISLGFPWAHSAPGRVPATGETSLCLIPMGPVADPLGSCSDHTPSWSGGEDHLDPE